MKCPNLFFRCAIAGACLFSLAAGAAPKLGDVHPELAGGILTEARLDTLPEDEVMRADDIVITAAMMKEKIAELPNDMRLQAENFLFYLLESEATERILIREVMGDAEGEPDEAALREKFGEYRHAAVGEVAVSDAEMEAFYNENRSMLPDVPFEQIRPGIEGHLKQEKQGEVWNAYLQGMGGRLSIVLDTTWTNDQVKRLMDNPVDKARAAGKPALVDFGAEGCPACRMLKPIMASLKNKVGDQAAIVEVNLNEHQFLANRFNVSGIPLLVFYDKDGNEAHRHTGFMSEEDAMRHLNELGVN